MDENNGIGFEGKIPWRVSSDLQRFKLITLNHHILMGRKTYQSIGKPLPNRTNLIVSRNPDFLASGCHVFNSIGLALDFAKKSGETELFVIGGAEIYKMTIAIADKMYLTRVLANCKFDTKFPDYNKYDWDLISEKFFPAGEKDEFNSIFYYYEKKRKK